MSELILKRDTLECRGKGPTFSSDLMATPAEIITALGQTHHTASGRISKSTKRQKGYPKSWWEAQVRLYAVECKDWTIDGMKKALMDKAVASFQPPAELIAVEKGLNHDHQSMDNEYYQHPRSTSSTNIPTESSKSLSTLPTTQVKITNPQESRRGEPTTGESQLEKINRLHAQHLSSGPPDDVIFGVWQFDCLEDDLDNDIIWEIYPPYIDSDECLWAYVINWFVEGVVKISCNNVGGWKGKKLWCDFRGREIAGDYTDGDHRTGHAMITFTSTHECTCTFYPNIPHIGPWNMTGRKVSNKVEFYDASKCRAAYYRKYGDYHTSK